MRPSPPTDPLVSPPEEGQVLSRWLAPVRRFLRLEAAGGIMIMAFAAAALLWVNSPFAASYNALWHARFHIGPVGGGLDLTIAHWVNDGLMAVFFLLVGLEMKREVLIGELSSPRRAALPLIGALGGTMVPALLYIAVVMMGGERSMLRGWAVPMATDIAICARRAGTARQACAVVFENLPRRARHRRRPRRRAGDRDLLHRLGIDLRARVGGGDCVLPDRDQPPRREDAYAVRPARRCALGRGARERRSRDDRRRCAGDDDSRKSPPGDFRCRARRPGAAPGDERFGRREHAGNRLALCYPHDARRIHPRRSCNSNTRCIRG